MRPTNLCYGNSQTLSYNSQGAVCHAIQECWSQIFEFNFTDTFSIVSESSNAPSNVNVEWKSEANPNYGIMISLLDHTDTLEFIAFSEDGKLDTNEFVHLYNEVAEASDCASIISMIPAQPSLLNGVHPEGFISKPKGEGFSPLIHSILSIND